MGRAGADGGLLWAAALALAPLLTLGVRSWWDRPLGRGLGIAPWLIAAVAATAASGGGVSPAAALFLVPPALALAWTGRAWRTLALSVLIAAPTLGAGAGQALVPAAAAALGLSAMLLAVALLAIRGAAEPALRQAAGAPQPAQLAAFAHELRTPLHQILGFAEVIEERLFGDAPTQYAEYGGLIRTAGAHLLDLAEAWLEQARLEAGARPLEPERFDLAGLAQDVARGFERQLQVKTQRLCWLSFTAPFWVEADRRAWRQILTNLLANAVKFTPEHGKVAISLTLEGDMVRLAVEDSGPGVPLAERGRLARPFVRGQAGQNAEGAGLGLAIVKGLLSLHQGRLEIGSSALGGARFAAAAPIAVPDGAADALSMQA